MIRQEDLDKAEGIVRKKHPGSLTAIYEAKLTPRDTEVKALIHGLRTSGIMKLGDIVTGRLLGTSGGNIISPAIKVEGKIEGRDESSRAAPATRENIIQAIGDGEPLYMKHGKRYIQVHPEALGEALFIRLASKPSSIKAWTSWDCRAVLSLPKR